MVLTAMFKVLWVHCLPAFLALRERLSGPSAPWAQCHPLAQVARCSPSVRCRIQRGGTSGASAETWAASAALEDASEVDSLAAEVLDLVSGVLKGETDSLAPHHWSLVAGAQLAVLVVSESHPIDVFSYCQPEILLRSFCRWSPDEEALEVAA